MQLTCQSWPPGDYVCHEYYYYYYYYYNLMHSRAKYIRRGSFCLHFFNDTFSGGVMKSPVAVGSMLFRAMFK